MDQDVASYATLTPLQRLAAARAAAAVQMPYLRAALLALVPYERPGLNTMGVTKSMILLWDPIAMTRWSRDEAICTLLHEVWHILRDHAGRREQIQAEQRLWNIACDAEINDDLHAAFPDIVDVGIGDGWILPTMFNLENGGIAEGYYNQLKTLNTATASAPNAGGGWCGSGGGQSVPNEPDEEESNQDASQSAPSGTKPSIGRSAAEVEKVRKRVAEAVRDEARKGRGSIPGGWLRWAALTLKPPRVRWQDKLARATRSAIAYRSGSVDWTYKKISRRQAGVGYGKGRPILHAMHTPVPRVDVWVDTSGSMSENELATAIREVRGVLATGATVDFGVIDTEIHAAQQVRDWREIPKLLKGGGGTDFRPAFEASSKKRDCVGDRVLVFITDGCGPAPAAQPRGMCVIWLLVGPYRQRPCEWGEVIEIDDEASETS
jgi:predicted metal-dependent peptidase